LKELAQFIIGFRIEDYSLEIPFKALKLRNFRISESGIEIKTLWMNAAFGAKWTSASVLIGAIFGSNLKHYQRLLWSEFRTLTFPN